MCALLHDIGDTLGPYNHPTSARPSLKPFVSEANHWMVEKHGIFQGYYFWHHIGMDRNTRDGYRDSPYFDYTGSSARSTTRLRSTSTTERAARHYEPLLRRFFAPSSAVANSE